MDKIYINKESIKLLKSLGVDVVSSERKYWFLRTQNGTYYDEFKAYNFIGIEWDKLVDFNSIRDMSKDQLKEHIIEKDSSIERPGYVASQILRFCNEIRKGDIVLIPNEGSEEIAFGEVLSDDIVDNNSNNNKKDFQKVLDETYSPSKKEAPLFEKKRRIKWLKTVKRDNLDPYLYNIIYSHNTIVGLQKYNFYIDRQLSDFYIKGDHAFFTYRVNKVSNIPYVDMLEFLNTNKKIIDYINEKANLDINFDDIIMKINVQSKGPVQLKGTVKTILVFGVGIMLLCGGNFSFNGFGMNFSVETEGVSKLINSVSKAINENNDPELQVIKKELENSKDKLEITVPNEKK
ncbi:restriction endonuclease [Clostridium perfringens]|uniref:restriction endonuclease n=3 Tax=Clostridium perfringens TaxID=1502 RepID=UPI000666897D|nr:hypothetical protein [Clostridium perfringens]EJT6540322.1 hypothetical protein [Clostridium perfringens]EJT6565329.1 hypothetical protein [Clostridium perfringens]MBX9099065.1 hypothetical protein [Clostridium perfringens]MCX0394504.1 hypothetical protein [Clostridium perfringens]MDB2040007.1 hypothetical protein [Clostridium perfringens]